MTSILMGVVVVAIIAGVIWLMMRIVRAARERRREAWRAGGSVGTGPGSGCSGGGGCGGGGCGGGELRRRRLRRRRLRRRRLRRRR